MVPTARLRIEPFEIAATQHLAATLGVSFTLAQILVRRGYGEAKAARTWLAADIGHDPGEFEAIEQAIAAIEQAIATGVRITVHGDYDVDGVCSTAILIRTLRTLGANVGWYLPSRSEDGYGLSERGVRTFAAQGTELLICVDCGITAVEQIELACELGLDVIVVDHHAPRADGRLPAAAIVHPVVNRYPCPDLCATGVAYKLAAALYRSAGRSATLADDELDLVALATVADCVPLTDENRRLVRVGLRALAQTARPGLRALFAVAGIEPSRINARDIGFGLAPRLNAVGRVDRPDAALELLMTTAEQRAQEIAAELSHANSERRKIGQEITAQAEAQVRELGPRPAYVLWSEQWNPGVIGIVAARIAEQQHRPVVLVALDGEGGGTGSGRSIPAYDLLAGLTASATQLERFGGHRAAAGCTVVAARLEQFRAQFCAHAAATLSEQDLIAEESVDAIIGVDDADFKLAEELSLLEPFGIGNPDPSILIRAVPMIDARKIGSGQHLRFKVTGGGACADVVAFGRSTLPKGADSGHFDATFSLAINEYRGVSRPQLKLRKLVSTNDNVPELIGEPDPGSPEYREMIFARCSALVAAASAARSDRLTDAQLTALAADLPRRCDDRRGRSASATISTLVGSGEQVFVLCLDSRARREQMTGRIGGFKLCDWNAFQHDRSLIATAARIVLLDPPPHPYLLQSLAEITGNDAISLAWGSSELRYSCEYIDREIPSRDDLARDYGSLRAEASIAAAFSNSYWPQAALRLAVLVDLGLVTLGERGSGTVSVPAPTGRTDLQHSDVLRCARAEHEERSRWLMALQQTTVVAMA